MIGNASKFSYTAYGFQIASDFPHPVFTPSNGNAAAADIIIEFGDLSALWSEMASPEESCICKENLVMFHIPEVATFLIANGNQIVVSPVKGATPVQIRLFLDGYCMATIMLQRNILPLHGSAVVVDGKAYAIIGRSGAGKSTLAKVFLEQGYSFLSDDVIPVDLTHESGEVMVFPAFPEQKLWQESLHGLGMESRVYSPIYEKELTNNSTNTRRMRTKFAIPVFHYTDRPMPLKGIFELAKADNEEEVGVHPLNKNEQLCAVMHHTFHSSLIVDLGLLEWHFRTSVGLMNRTEVFKLKRSETSFSARELVSSILERIDKERI